MAQTCGFRVGTLVVNSGGRAESPEWGIRVGTLGWRGGFQSEHSDAEGLQKTGFQSGYSGYQKLGFRVGTLVVNSGGSAESPEWGIRVGTLGLGLGC